MKKLLALSLFLSVFFIFTIATAHSQIVVIDQDWSTHTFQRKNSTIPFVVHWTPAQEITAHNYRWYYYWSLDPKIDYSKPVSTKKVFTLEILYKDGFGIYFIRRKTANCKVEAFGRGEALIASLRKMGNKIIITGELDLNRPYVLKRVGESDNGKSIFEVFTDDTYQPDILFAKAEETRLRRNILAEKGSEQIPLPDLSNYERYKLGEAFMYEPRKNWCWPKSKSASNSEKTNMNDVTAANLNKKP